MEINNYYNPIRDKIFISSINDSLYKHNGYITNGEIVISKHYIPNLITDITPEKISENLAKYIDDVVSIQKILDVIKQYNTLDYCSISYKGCILYHTKKRKDVLINKKYDKFLDLGLALQDTKTQMIYVFDYEEDDEEAGLDEEYNLICVVMPIDRKSKYHKEIAKTINKLENYLNEANND